MIERDIKLHLVADNGDVINDPHKNLLIAVLVRAIQDASDDNMMGGGGYDSKAARTNNIKRIQDNAKYWLFEATHGALEDYCDTLGLDPSWVRKVAKKRIEMGSRDFNPRAAQRIKRRYCRGGNKAKAIRKQMRAA